MIADAGDVVVLVADKDLEEAAAALLRRTDDLGLGSFRFEDPGRRGSRPFQKRR